MDLEHLTKHQIVLLTLLVSFVTSIATGIVTVSLVNQAPPGVTSTINQIVERTVEKVVPATMGAAIAESVRLPEPARPEEAAAAALASSDDLATQSIAKTQKSLVRIVSKGGNLLLSRGVIVTAQGTAFADRDALARSGYRQFEAILSDGRRYPATLRAAAAKNQAIAIVDIAVGTSTGFIPAPLAEQSKVQLGQSVIRIGGTGQDTVGSGIIATLPDAHSGLIEASVSSATPGSILITLFGEIIGIATSQARDAGPAFYALPAQSLLAPPASS